MAKTLRIAALVVTSAVCASAHAQTPEQPQPEHRGLSLLLSAGQYSGFGGGLAFGTREEVLSRHGFTIPPEVRQRWVDQTIDGLEHLEESQSAEQYREWERDRLRRLVVECGVGPDDAEVMLSFSGDGQALATASTPDTVILWNVVTGRESKRFTPAERDEVRCLACSPDGARIAAGYTNGGVRVAPGATCSVDRRWPEHQPPA